MYRRKNDNSVFYVTHSIELLVWLIVVLLVVATCSILYMHNEKHNNDYSIFLPDIDGLIVGSPVRILGIDVGHVVKIKPVNDTVYVNSVYWTVELFMDCDMTKTDPNFYIRKLEWLLKNGANVNVYKQGKTGLDLLNLPPRVFLNEKPVDERAITDCKKLMLQYGALTMNDLKKQESLNNDYRIELGRMK